MAERYNGPPATIGDMKRLGMTGFFVYCSGLYCHKQRRFEFDALGLQDDVPFIDIPKSRQFVCERCGGFEVTVGGDWKEYHDAYEQKRQERLNGPTTG
jgi:hypothetical protein